MDEAKLIEEFQTDELIDELKSRKDGFSSIDIDDLVDELKYRQGVDYVEQDSKYGDYVVAIENGSITNGTGKVIILIVEV